MSARTQRENARARACAIKIPVYLIPIYRALCFRGRAGRTVLQISTYRIFPFADCAKINIFAVSERARDLSFLIVPSIGYRN